MSFSPPLVGCLLKKLTKGRGGGSRAPQDPHHGYAPGEIFWLSALITDSANYIPKRDGEHPQPFPLSNLQAILNLASSRRLRVREQLENLLEKKDSMGERSAWSPHTPRDRCFRADL